MYHSFQITFSPLFLLTQYFKALQLPLVKLIQIMSHFKSFSQNMTLNVCLKSQHISRTTQDLLEFYEPRILYLKEILFISILWPYLSKTLNFQKILCQSWCGKTQRGILLCTIFFLDRIRDLPLIIWGWGKFGASSPRGKSLMAIPKKKSFDGPYQGKRLIALLQGGGIFLTTLLRGKSRRGGWFLFYFSLVPQIIIGRPLYIIL